MNEIFSVSARIAATALTASGVFFVGYANTSEPTMEIRRVGVEQYHVTSLRGATDVNVVHSGFVKRPEYQPKTKLGKALWDASQAIVASGEPLFDAKVLLAELAASRGY